jgi:predicted  nucleic acid-binding Zn-ribbon protein
VLLGGANVGRVKASPEAQLRLLELADLDAELARLDHRRQTLPEIAQLQQIDTRSHELRDGIVMADTELSDLDREQTRAERDVDQVRQRIDRDQTRLDGGQVSAARELSNLQSEVESLHRRQSDLEEVVLDVMERRESVETRRSELATEQESLAGQAAELTTRRDAALEEIGEAAAKAEASRVSVVTDVPADVLTLYDKLRAQHGVGAAMLRRGSCEGCHLTLHTVDLNQIRATPADEVVRCEECRRILVRTAESGL